jgi:hypothetical protein
MDSQFKDSHIDSITYSKLRQISLRLTLTGYLDKFHDLFSQLFSQEMQSNAALDPDYRRNLKIFLSDIVDQVWAQTSHAKPPQKRTDSHSYTESLTVPETSTSTPKSSDSLSRGGLFVDRSTLMKGHRRVNTASGLCGNRCGIPARDPLEVRSSFHSQISSRAVSPSSNLRQKSPKLIHKRSHSSIFEEISSKLSKFSEFSHIRSPGTFPKSGRNIHSGASSPGPAAYKCDRLSLSRKFPRAVIGKGGVRHSYIQSSGSPGPNKYFPMKYFASRYY